MNPFIIFLFLFIINKFVIKNEFYARKFIHAAPLFIFHYCYDYKNEIKIIISTNLIVTIFGIGLLKGIHGRDIGALCYLFIAFYISNVSVNHLYIFFPFFLSDPLGAIIGTNIKSYSIPYTNKTLAGSSAVFLSAYLMTGDYLYSTLITFTECYSGKYDNLFLGGLGILYHNYLYSMM